MFELVRSLIVVAGVVGVVSAAPASPQTVKIESRFAELNSLRMH